MIIYCFDLKPKNKKDYNRLKRRFYYHLAKSGLANAPWKTKSVLSVPNSSAPMADAFFRQWRGSIEVYKIYASAVRELS
ncbi:MAG: hypothetical protein Q7T16_03815 [Candidatus Burarchaeum sp.]|nr:hypothetical protein [Candidatus Burarchaeum sp.]MDO8339759.1 hypothetical protein [Candidatus Burarchaeum sp.]